VPQVVAEDLDAKWQREEERLESRAARAMRDSSRAD